MTARVSKLAIPLTPTKGRSARRATRRRQRPHSRETRLNIRSPVKNYDLDRIVKIPIPQPIASRESLDHVRQTPNRYKTGDPHAV